MVVRDLGALASGGRATVEIRVRPERTGTITNFAAVGARQRDPNRRNNVATAQTVVQP